ncbi:hypothetical protein ElP_70850 (plasmid) [Tautonia plasticadhaerens]|uniref:DOD-type homing endonuclease domain-containing protein n=1 Tax=Tautonia plasticadhaerens TaxID=2527974 RepID=A0A518HE59_9BACT|nr:hypothetical protein ElP_70850 [Tautonia plasticadhaerens]
MLGIREQPPERGGLLRIRTLSGRMLVVGPEQPVAVMGPDARPDATRADRLVPGGNRLMVVRPTLPPEDEPDPEEFDYGCLAGLYAAEGDCPKVPGVVRIAVAPDDRAREFLDLYARLDLDGYRTQGRVYVTDHPAREWLEGTIGRGSHRKRLPPELLGHGRSFVEGLVAAYMAGDGSGWGYGSGTIQVSAASVSAALRDGVVDTLAALGVFATRLEIPRPGGTRGNGTPTACAWSTRTSASSGAGSSSAIDRSGSTLRSGRATGPPPSTASPCPGRRDRCSTNSSHLSRPATTTRARNTVWSPATGWSRWTAPMAVGGDRTCGSTSSPPSIGPGACGLGGSGWSSGAWASSRPGTACCWAGPSRARAGTPTARCPTDRGRRARGRSPGPALPPDFSAYHGFRGALRSPPSEAEISRFWSQSG